MFRQLKLIFWVLSTILVTACSGDAFTNGAASPSVDPTGDPSGNTAATISVVADNIQLSSDGSDFVTITATVKDTDNVLIKDASVKFTANSGDLVVTQATTDDAGKASASLSAGDDPSNRTIEVIVSSGSVSDSIFINVAGTQLNIDGPGSLVLGSVGTWTVTLKDASNDGIDGKNVTVKSELGNTLSTESLVTDATGQTQLQLTATVSGEDTIEVSALGLTATATVEVSGDDFQFTGDSLEGQEINLNNNQAVTVRWLKNTVPQTGETINFSTTRGEFDSSTAVTDGNGDATVNISSNNAGPAVISATAPGGAPAATLGVEFVATQADSLDLQADPSTIGPNESSTVTAVVRDPNDNLVKNKTVLFSLQDVTGGSLSVPQAVTDSLGRATSVYTATDVSSAKDGVKVTATTVQDAVTVKGETTLTVAKKALRITMNTGNELEEPNTVQYKQPWVVQVTDANGNPAPANTAVTISILPTRYIKGEYVPSKDDNDKPVAPWIPAADSTICINEDLNRNGVLDGPAEDINGNGKLEIPNPATITAGSGSGLTTNNNGEVFFSATYPQGNGIWSEVELKATVEVEGTETSVSKTYVLPVLADDVNDLGKSPPGGINSPYGTVRNCAEDG